MDTVDRKNAVEPDEETMDEASHRTDPVHNEDVPITRQQIQDVIADPGYSAGQREGRLKEMLTELTKRENDPAYQEMIGEVEEALDKQSKDRDREIT